jgi:hypothetical protein
VNVILDPPPGSFAHESRTILNPTRCSWCVMVLAVAEWEEEHGAFSEGVSMSDHALL